MVRDMQDDLREDIHSNKDSQPSNNTVNDPNEAEIILTSLEEMRIDPPMRAHAFDKIMGSAAWRPVWDRVGDGMRRAFLNDFVVVPQTPFVFQPPNPYNQVSNPYNQPPNSFNQPPNSFSQPRTPKTSLQIHTTNYQTPTTSHLLLRRRILHLSCSFTFS